MWLHPRGPVLTLSAAPLLMLLVASPAAAGDDLSLRVTPQFCRAPCPLTMVVGLDPHADDRALLFEADSGGFFRSSQIQLDGDDEPSIHRLRFDNLPAGVYEIRVTLTRNDGVEARVTEDVRVLGR